MKVVACIFILFFLPVTGFSQISFTWARLKYPNKCPDETCLKSYYTDFPGADKTISEMLQRITKLRTDYKLVDLETDKLSQYPFIYIVEPEQMWLAEKDRAKLKEYLRRGGFILMDDFHGEEELAEVLALVDKVWGKDLHRQDLTLAHPLFSILFDIHKLEQVVNDGLILCGTCDLWEGGPSGREPRMIGFFNQLGDLQLLLAYNNDLGDGIEWADQGFYPQPMAAFAIRLLTNIVLFSLTH